MEIRYRLHPKLDAKLIEKILARAEKNRPSAAAKLMTQEWSFAEDVAKLAVSGQLVGTEWAVSGQDDSESVINLSSLDAALKDIGE